MDININNKGAKETLKLINDELFNIDRPSSSVIANLINVIVYLDKRIKKLEKEKNK